MLIWTSILLWGGFALSSGFTIPTEETASMLVNGVRYDQLPVIHIKSSKNNTIIIVTDHSGEHGKACLVKIISIRVPTHPGKSWIFSWIFQALESPGKSVWSWKALEMKA